MAAKLPNKRDAARLKITIEAAVKAALEKQPTESPEVQNPMLSWYKNQVYRDLKLEKEIGQ